MKSWTKIHPGDNVLVALETLEAGTVINEGDQRIELTQTIDKGHKVATESIQNGESVTKYGFAIGQASDNIRVGEWVHSHNLQTALCDEMSYQYQPMSLPEIADSADIPVNLHRRDNGEVGIRNELWVIPTVGCVNGIARQLVDEFTETLRQSGCDGEIDGVFYFPHQFGCSQLGDDHRLTQKLLQGMARHPNAGGVLVLGLGCENNQISQFRETLGDFDDRRVRFMACQQVEDELESGMEILHELFDTMRNDRRQPGKLSELRFGLECGGSDGLSGITANPLLGAFSDRVISMGGTTVLTEVPEMFGAETLLMNRTGSPQLFDEVVGLINGFKRYFTDHNQPVYENPSPGNKRGGITTLEEKSLGCVQKAGVSEVRAVVDYGERITNSGLTLLNAPGNDAIATSALAAAGCHMVLFTTGRGTPYGGFVPTCKLATNTPLAEKKPRWIDFDAGVLVHSDVTLESLCQQFIDYLVTVINGEKVCNEKNNIRELAVWKQGVTL